MEVLISSSVYECVHNRLCPYSPTAVHRYPFNVGPNRQGYMLDHQDKTSLGLSQHNTEHPY